MEVVELLDRYVKKNDFLFKDKQFTYYIYSYVLILIFVILIILSYFFKIDVVVNGKFKVVSSIPTSQIVNVVPGKLILKQYENGAIVEKGEILYKVEAKENVAKAVALETQYLKKEKIKAELEEYYISIEKGKIVSKESKYFDDSNAFVNLKRKLESEIAFLNKEYRLYVRATDSIPEIELDQKRNNLTNKQTELREIIYRKKSDIKIMLEDMNKKAVEISNEITYLNATIQNSVVYSPIKGIVQEKRKLNLGDVTLRDEIILEIIPLEYEEISEIIIPNSKISSVIKGREIKYKLDSLNYREWGVATGKIVSVPHGTNSKENNGTDYEIVGSFSKNVLYKKNGDSRKLQLGMAGIASIICDRKSIMDFIIEKMGFGKTQIEIQG